MQFFTTLQAEPVYEEKTEEEEDEEYIQELMELIRSNKFKLEEVSKVQSKLRQRYGIEDVQENILVEGAERENEESDPEGDPDISVAPPKQMESSAGAGIDTSEAMNSSEKVQPVTTPQIVTLQSSSHFDMQQDSNQQIIPSTSTFANQISQQETVTCIDQSEITPDKSKKTHIELNMSSRAIAMPSGTNSQVSVVRDDLRTPDSSKRASTAANYTFNSLGLNKNSTPHCGYSGNPKLNMSEMLPRLSRTSTTAERNENLIISPRPQVRKCSSMHVDLKRSSSWLSGTSASAGRNENLTNSPQSQVIRRSNMHVDLRPSPFQAREDDIFLKRNTHCQDRGSPRVNINNSPAINNISSTNEMRKTPLAMLLDYQSEDEGSEFARGSSNPLLRRTDSPTFDSARNSPYCANQPLDFAVGTNLESMQHSIFDVERSGTQPNMTFPRRSEPFRSYTPTWPRYNTYPSEEPNFNQYFPLECSPDMFSCPSPVFNQHIQQTSVSNVQMVLNLSPNFERVPRNLGNDSDFDEDDLFEE